MARIIEHAQLSQNRNLLQGGANQQTKRAQVLFYKYKSDTNENFARLVSILPTHSVYFLFGCFANSHARFAELNIWLILRCRFVVLIIM